MGNSGKLATPTPDPTESLRLPTPQMRLMCGSMSGAAATAVGCTNHGSRLRRSSSRKSWASKEAAGRGDGWEGEGVGGTVSENTTMRLVDDSGGNYMIKTI